MKPVRRRLLIAGIASCLAVPLLQAPAVAAVTCTFDSAAARVTVSVTGDGATSSAGIAFLAVGPAGEILFNDLFSLSGADPCGAATVTNTDRIVVNGSTDSQHFRISDAGGPFRPGRTAESDSDEIEFTINLGSGIEDHFSLESAPAFLAFGAGSPLSPSTRRAAFTSDQDSDIAFTGVERISASGGPADNLFTGQGGFGTGGPYPLPISLLRGGGGADLIRGGSAEDTLFGDEGNDTIEGFGGGDTIGGFEGGDVMNGGPGDDDLDDNTSEFVDESGILNRFIPGPDDDIVRGRSESGARNLVDYSSATTGVIVNLATGTATGEGSDTLIDIDDATGSGLDDRLSGNERRNTLRGGGGVDLLQGAQENDTLLPGPGSDDVRGGQGSDTLSYSDSAVVVDVNLGAGTATDTGTDTLAPNIENVTGSLGSDDITGSSGPNVLFGFNGDDDIFALEGDDTLDGGFGNDDLVGGPGTDTCGQGAGTGVLDGCENVGTFELKPRRAAVSAGEPIDYLLTWTHPRRWRSLDTVELRIRDGSRVLVWVRWNQEGNTFQLFDPGDDRFVSGRARGPGTLRSPFAVLHLRRSDQVVFDTKTIGVLMRLSFREAAAGGHIVEATAEDDRGNRMAWERAGTLKVSAA